MDIFWSLPTQGDGRYLGTQQGARAVDYAYLTQIAQAIDHLGFEGALLPTSRACEDSWIAAASLISVTQKLKFLVAVRPSLISPTLAARMTATFDRLSGGRLLVNIVPGDDPVELAGDGLWLKHGERYQAADEFLRVWRAVLAGEMVDFNGQYLKIKGAQQLLPPLSRAHPPLYFEGSSSAAYELAAEHADVYLTQSEPPAAVADKIADIRRRATDRDRQLRFGIRLHVIVRESNKAAWQAAYELIRYADAATIAAAQVSFARMDTGDQKSMMTLHQGCNDRLEIAPNLWAGVGLVRGGAGTALVGDAPTVAERMLEYAELGIDTFILSGYPYLEEAYRVAELLFPYLSDSSQTSRYVYGI